MDTIEVVCCVCEVVSVARVRLRDVTAAVNDGIDVGVGTDKQVLASVNRGHMRLNLL